MNSTKIIKSTTILDNGTEIHFRVEPKLYNDYGRLLQNASNHSNWQEFDRVISIVREMWGSAEEDILRHRISKDYYK